MSANRKSFIFCFKGTRFREPVVKIITLLITTRSLQKEVAIEHSLRNRLKNIYRNTDSDYLFKKNSNNVTFNLRSYQ